MKLPKISIVVPVYNEEANTAEFLRRTATILESITQDYEIIFALDPCKDKTEEVILSARIDNPRVKLLKFSRRFGQPMSTLAGLQYSSGDAVIVMDVDLQDPPELITQMVSKWQEGFDVVYAQRKSREGETWVKEVVSDIGYRIIDRMSEVSIPRDTGDFRLMSRRVVDEINRLKETHGFLRGMVALVGFHQTAILFDRPARFSGKGNYNRFLGSLRIGLNGLYCFSHGMLTLSFQAGFLFVGIAFIIGLAHFLLNIFGKSFASQFPLISALILFIGGIQLIGIGILGEYIGRIYEEVRQRPKFIVDKKVGFEEVL